MSEHPALLTDLPLDILVLIFPYLDARSFLSLCSTCKSLQSEQIRLDPTYWSHAVRTTFRVPNRPVAQSDGQRWYRLFKRLLTQSRVFTWGSNTNGCLGHSYDESPPPPHYPHGPPLRLRGAPMRLRGRGPRPARVPPGVVLTDKVAWPKEMESTTDLGIVADLQCGGWSTTILNSKGVLYTVGMLNGERNWGTDPVLSPLKYPAGFPHPSERYDRAVAIRQFSSGRQHILGVADSGRIWSWYNAKKPGLHVKFLHHETVEDQSIAHGKEGHGRVLQVVAGWNKSSALINGVGIVLWEPIDGHGTGIELDTMMVAETATVPDSNYSRPKRNAREFDSDMQRMGGTVGEIVNYIVLEAYVVFVTDLGRVFCSKIQEVEGNVFTTKTLELPNLHRRSDSDGTACATDVHGSFRSFAILKSTGEVLTATQSYLDACWSYVHDNLSPGTLEELPYTAFESISAAGLAPADTPPGFRELYRYPALQNAGVIALAFGDYHFHALHSNGRITSYGREPKACGALGLGSHSADTNGTGEGDMRGIKYLGFMRDGELVPRAYETGRQVWFQREKATWLEFLANGGHDSAEAQERMISWRQSQEVQGLVSDWVERQGRDWDKRVSVQTAADDGFGAHFALSVAAAGWHSGALVLVNESLADAVARSCVIEDPEFGKNAGEEPLGPEPQVEEVSGSTAENEEGQHTDSTLSHISDVASNLVRSFLGLPLTGRPADSEVLGNQAERNQGHGPAMNPCASPGRGLRYSWAYESFPRLTMRDGTVMPGTVELS